MRGPLAWTVLTRVALVLPPVLVLVWVQVYDLLGGFAGDKTGVLNYHVLFMTIAFFTCTGEALLAFSSWSLVGRAAKMLHVGLHTCSVLFAALGLVATVDYHNRNDVPHIYSLHSWLGVFAFACFATMFVTSFAVFVFPRASRGVRHEVQAWHAAMGVAMFVLFVAVILTGIQNLQASLIYSQQVTSFGAEALFANATAIALVFAALSVLLRLYHLKMRPADEALFVHDDKNLLYE